MGLTILDASVLQYKARPEEVTIEELGGAVLLRKFSSAEYYEFIQPVAKGIDEDKPETSQVFAFELLRLTWVDSDGNPVLGNDDYEAFHALPLSVINKLTAAAAQVNGLGDDAVESAEKN